MVVRKHTFLNWRRHCRVLHTQSMRSEFSTPIHFTTYNRFCYHYKFMGDHTFHSHSANEVFVVGSLWIHIRVWALLHAVTDTLATVSNSVFFLHFIFRFKKKLIARGIAPRVYTINICMSVCVRNSCLSCFFFFTSVFSRLCPTSFCYSLSSIQRRVWNKIW